MTVPYFVLVTISRQNLESLKSTMDWLHAKKIAVIRSPFVPRGAAAKARHLCFDRNDMDSKIHPALRDNPLSYVSYTPFFAAPDATRLTLGGRGLNLGNLGCQAGRTFIGINAEGDVAPCVHLLDSPVCCGNVREQPLSRILAESEIMRTLRGERPVKGKCGRCRYGDSCRGCRALAHYHTGDYLAEDPSCFFEPESIETRSPYEDMQTANARLFLNHLVQNPPWSDIFGAQGRLGVTLLNLKARLNTFLGNRLTMKILLVKPRWFVKDGVYRFLTHVSFEPLHLGILAALSEGHDVKVIDHDWDEIPFGEGFDLVGLTATTFSSQRAFDIADVFPEERRQGGHRRRACLPDAGGMFAARRRDRHRRGRIRVAPVAQGCRRRRPQADLPAGPSPRTWTTCPSRGATCSGRIRWSA